MCHELLVEGECAEKVDGGFGVEVVEYLGT